MTLHFILLKKIHIPNQSIVKKNFMYLQKWFHDNYLGLNMGKCYYMTFGLNPTKNEFVLEDGTIDSSAEEKTPLQKIDLLFPFRANMQKGCK